MVHNPSRTPKLASYLQAAPPFERILINGALPTLLLESPDGQTFPLFVAVDELRDRVYVTYAALDAVAVIDPLTFADGILDNEVVDTFGVGLSPAGIAVDETRNRVYIANQGDHLVDGTISVVDGANVVDGIDNNEILETIALAGEAYGVAVDTARNRIYVIARLGNSVTVINGAAVADGIAGNEIVDTISVGNGTIGIATDELRNRVYVINEDDDTVSVIDGAAVADGIAGNEVVDTISVGDRPLGVAVSEGL